MSPQEEMALINQRKAQEAASLAQAAYPGEAADVAAIQATGPADAALGRVGRRTAAATPAAMRMIQSVTSPSVALPLATGVGVGLATRNPALTRNAVTAATAVGTSFENWANGEGVFSMENAKDVGINSSIAYFGDILAGRVGGAISKKAGGIKDRVKAKAIGTVTDGAVDAHAIGKRLAKDAEDDVMAVVAEGGIPLTPDDLKRANKGIFTAPQLMESQALDQTEGFVRGSFIGSGALRRIDLLQTKVFDAAKTAYKRAVGPFYDDAGKLGTLLSRKIDDFAEGTSTYTSAQHQFVDEMVGDAPVDLRSVVADADGVIASMEKLKGASPGIQGVDSVVGTIKNLRDKVTATLPARVGASGDLVRPKAVDFTWREAKQLRTAYREAGQVLKRNGANTAAKDATTIEGRLTKVMEEALDDKTPVDMAGRSVRQVWQRANRRTKDMVDLTEKAQLHAVIDLAEERNVGAQVVDKLAPKLGTAENVKVVRRLLGPKSDQWKALQRWRIEGLLNNMTPKKLASILTEVQQNGPGPAAYREMLGPHYDKVLDLLKAQQFAGLKNPAGAKVGTHLVENGLALSIPGSAFGGPVAVAGAMAVAGGWTISMRQLSKWLTNPKTSDMVLGLVKAGPKPPPFLLKQAIRAVEQGIAEGFIGQDDFIPMRGTGSKEEIKARNAAAYGGIRG